MLLAASAILAAGCSKTEVAEARKPPQVIVAKPVSRPITDYYEFFGETAAVNEVEVRARVTGYIKTVNFVDGEIVDAGKLLFQIDPDPYQALLDRAKAELERLQAMLKKAETDVARAERLRPSGAVSQDEYEQDIAQLKIDQAWIHAAEAAVREAELNMKFTRVTAPIAGRVSRARIREGNLVQSGQGDAAVLTTVVSISPIYAYFHIEEPALMKYLDLGWKASGGTLPKRIEELKIPVEVGLAGEKDSFPFKGTLDFLDNKVDRGTGTICARGVFDNTKQNLTPGLYVRVRVPIGKEHPAVLVSDRAIVTDQKEKFVLRVNADNKVEFLPVTLGAKQFGLRVIEKGLSPDDRIIVAGTQRAHRGDTVDPQPAKEPVAAASVAVAGE
jgi:RND family efflux transporter MFP subunit